MEYKLVKVVHCAQFVDKARFGKIEMVHTWDKIELMAKPIHACSGLTHIMLCTITPACRRFLWLFDAKSPILLLMACFFFPNRYLQLPTQQYFQNGSIPCRIFDISWEYSQITKWKFKFHTHCLHSNSRLMKFHSCAPVSSVVHDISCKYSWNLLSPAKWGLTLVGMLNHIIYKSM